MKLICQQCSHENEVERIYCHNCGTKLDRSKLPVEDPKAKKKRVRMGPPPLAIFFRKVGTFLSVVLGAALLAAILCIFKPAGDGPEISDEQKAAAPFFSTELEAIAASQVPVSRSYAEWQVSASIKDKAKARKTDVNTVKVVDGWIRFEPDQVTVVGRSTLYGLPTGFEEVWEIKSDAVPAKPRLVSAKIGRLSIPAAVAPPLVGFFSASFYKRFDTELKALKMLGAKIEKEKVTVFSGRPGGA